jgi:hypothetical protein
MQLLSATKKRVLRIALMDHLDTCINLNSTVIGGEDEYKTPVLARIDQNGHGLD